MCQLKRNGGRRCPVHTHRVTALIAALRSDLPEDSIITRHQVERLFAELRREGNRLDSYDTANYDKYMTELQNHVTEQNITVAEQQLELSREHDTAPDDATMYAVTRLQERVTARDEKLNTFFTEQAARTGRTPQELKHAYMAALKAAQPDMTPAPAAARNRYQNAGLPYDRASVAALEHICGIQPSETERVVQLQQVGTRSSIHAYGYSNGRLEIVFSSNTDKTYSYQNVPEHLWASIRNSSSPGRIISREIIRNPAYQYENAEASEIAAYAVRCLACGQFKSAATFHACPSQEARNLALANENPHEAAPARKRTTTNIPATTTALGAFTPELYSSTASSALITHAIRRRSSAATIASARMPDLTDELLPPTPETLQEQRHPRRAPYNTLMKPAPWFNPDVHKVLAWYDDEDNLRAVLTPEQVHAFETSQMLRREQSVIYDTHNHKVLGLYAGQAPDSHGNISRYDVYGSGMFEPELASVSLPDGAQPITLDIKPGAEPKQYRFDAALVPDQTAVTLPNHDAIKEALYTGEPVNIPVEADINYKMQGGLSDNGLQMAYGQDDVSVTGTLTVQLNKNGTIDTFSGTRSLKCSCKQYSLKYTCKHVHHMTTHAAKLIQQTIPLSIWDASTEQFGTPTHALMDDTFNDSTGYTLREHDGDTERVIAHAPIVDESLYGTGKRFDSSRIGYSYSVAEKPLVTQEDFETHLPNLPTLQKLQEMNRNTSFITHMTANARESLLTADTAFPLRATSDGNEIVGEVVFHKLDSEDDTLQVKRHTLKCDCGEYERTYDCEHVRYVITHTDRIVDGFNTHPEAVTDEATMASYTAALERYRDAQENSTDFDAFQKENVEILAKQERLKAVLAEKQQARRLAEQATAGMTKAERVAYEAEQKRQYAIHAENHIQERINRHANPDAPYTEETLYADYKEAQKLRNTDGILPPLTAGFTEGIFDPNNPGSRSFGIELEYTFKSGVNAEEATKRIAADLHDAGLTTSRVQREYHSSGDYDAWSFEEDSTVNGEVVSPILKDTPETWAQVSQVLEIVKRHGGETSDRAGSHITVSAGSYQRHGHDAHYQLINDVERTEDLLKRLSTNPQVGKHRGELYCSPGATTLAAHPGITKLDALELDDLGAAKGGMVNLLGSVESDPTKARVEVRAFDSTLDLGVIQRQVMFAGGLVDRAERTVIENGKYERTEPTRREPARVGDGVQREAAVRRMHDKEARASAPLTPAMLHHESESSVEVIESMFASREARQKLVQLYAVTKWQR